MPPQDVYGLRLENGWQRLGFAVWAVLFLIALAGFSMAVFYADLWFRTPYTEISKITSQYDPEQLETSLKPFQEAIQEIGFSLAGYSHYFTFLRVLAGLPFFALSIVIIRRRSDWLMAVFFAVILALFGAAGTLYTPLWNWIPDHYPWHPALSGLLSAISFSSLIILYTFPDGRIVPAWTRWLVILVVLYALSTSFPPGDSPLNPWSWPGPVAILLQIALLGTGVHALLYRFTRTANAVQKAQIKWFVAGASLVVLNWLLDFGVWEIYPALTGGDYLIQGGLSAVRWELFQDTSWYIAQFLFAICIAVIVFRYRLWEFGESAA